MAIIDLETRKPVTMQNETIQNEPSEFRTERSDNNVIPGGMAKIGETLDPSNGGASLRDSLRDTNKAFQSLLSEISLPNESADEETKAKGKWSPKELRPRHREMMRRILEGANYVEIAEEMGISTQAIMLVCTSTIFKEELKLLESELNLNVIQRAEDLSNEALDKLKMLMRKARSESLQASCAERVLGIAGYSKIEKKQVQLVTGADVIRELNRQRRETAEQRANGDFGSAAGTRPIEISESEDC